MRKTKAYALITYLTFQGNAMLSAGTHTFFNTINPQCVVRITDMVIVSHNSKWSNLLGYKNLKNSCLLDLIESEDRESFQQISQENPIQIMSRMRHKSGAIVWILWNGRIDDDHLMLSGHDYSSQFREHQAQEDAFRAYFSKQMKQQRNRLSITFNDGLRHSLSEMFLHLDTISTLCLTNEKAQESLLALRLCCQTMHKTLDGLSDQAVDDFTLSQAQKIAPDYFAHLKPPLSVLVAEDTPMMQKLYEVFLRKINCRFVIVDCGQAAVEQWQTGNFNFIFMDILMPGEIDGIEAVAKIRELEDEEQIPIFMISANSSREEQLRALRAGADGYIVKPFSFALIMTALKIGHEKTYSTSPRVHISEARPIPQGRPRRCSLEDEAIVKRCKAMVSHLMELQSYGQAQALIALLDAKRLVELDEVLQQHEAKRSSIHLPDLN